MTNSETTIFEAILNETGIQYSEDNGFYNIRKESYPSDCIQTNGYNLLESIRRLAKTKLVEAFLK